MEYLLLALDLRKVLFLLPGLGPLQTALLEVLESGCYCRLRSLGWSWRVADSLGRAKRRRVGFNAVLSFTYCTGNEVTSLEDCIHGRRNHRT